MQIPQHPIRVIDLDLMRLLASYKSGQKTWKEDESPLGDREKQACEILYTNIAYLLDSCIISLMNRVNSQEMRTFTMHDSQHGLKVAHIMWHILENERRKCLTPAEIALLVLSAFFHDLGMGLSDEERKSRLSKDSDLWEKVDIQDEYRTSVESLQKLISEGQLAEESLNEATLQVEQAKEALLCIDTRERHATLDRYSELFINLHEMHLRDPIKIPDIDACVSFDGDSFSQKLIDICISHNDDAIHLCDVDSENPDRPRFPRNYPVGCCMADTLLVAVLLRIADILDFDRERTPPVLFYYLLPSSGNPEENIAIREWNKHLSISNWQINGDGSIIFRGRCNKAIVHHAIVEFCSIISKEIYSIYNVCGESISLYIKVKGQVNCQIVSEGYRYLPYKFSLDEEKIYSILMGKSIYNNELDAIRELIQNAVDACALKDALMRRYHPSEEPSLHNRIILQYEEPRNSFASPRLSIIDSGVGMDRFIIENYLLKIGKSFYNSSEFLRLRSDLRNHQLDFAPVSEFGIGIMSCFMLSNTIEIETSAWRAPRGDNRRRLLRINGPGRLIEVLESSNNGVDGMSGTRITIYMRNKLFENSGRNFWKEIIQYVKENIIDIKYKIMAVYINGDTKETYILSPQGNRVAVPDYLEKIAVHIPVNDELYNLTGEIVLFREQQAEKAQKDFIADGRVHLTVEMNRDDIAYHDINRSALIRGGFFVGNVPGLPSYIFTPASRAVISISYNKLSRFRLASTDIGRRNLTNMNSIAHRVTFIWLKWLLDNIEDVEQQGFGLLDIRISIAPNVHWLEEYGAYAIYRLARALWKHHFKSYDIAEDRISMWENGEGKELGLGIFDSQLHVQLLDIVLPHITSLLIGKESRRYVKPIHGDWKSKLEGCMNFITIKKEWPVFNDFASNIDEYFYEDYAGAKYLNRKFRDRFNSFSDSEIIYIPKLLKKITHCNEYNLPIFVSPYEHDLILRIKEVAGDLKINHLSNSWTINEMTTGL